MQNKILKTIIISTCLWQGVGIALAKQETLKSHHQENPCPEGTHPRNGSCWERMSHIKPGNEPCPRGQEPHGNFCWKIAASINTEEDTHNK